MDRPRRFGRRCAGSIPAEGTKYKTMPERNRRPHFGVGPNQKFLRGPQNKGNQDPIL